MENKSAMWKIVGVVAVLALVASFGIIFNIVSDIGAMQPRDTSVLDEILNALRKADSSYAKEE